MIRLTREELKQYDGTNGKPAYIAYKGKIYDVSESPLWHNGWHWGEHKAGEDLTEDLKFAPHGEEMLENVPIVGELID
ncbi:MAG: cytochrome B5 [Gammaproteobacteria bacterium]|nr:MAG: cytochrome B5 [Gammaproteobacteria bacterium]RTZ67927.1 MAG: cytochrome B5 [Aquificaceae bacterium]